MFTICGKKYDAPKDLLHREEYEYIGDWKYPDCQMTVYRDIHGRRVLHLDEKFPCFDVWDSLYEHRYYHWYFVAHESGVAVAYTEDERDEISVVENMDAPSETYIHVRGDMEQEIEKSGMLNRV